MASKVSSPSSKTTMAPPVEPKSAPPISSPRDSSSLQSPAQDISNPARRSRVFSSSDTPSKRFSTASNPAREAPRPDHSSTPNSPPNSTSVGPSISTPASTSTSPGPGLTSPPSTGTSTRHKIPSFPPPQTSRVSVMSISSNRDSFHPQFASSLSYATVRDFAYPPIHPLHYGPTINSGLSTPAGSQRESGYMESGSGGSNWFTGGGSGYRRLSDPAVSSMDSAWGDSNIYRQRHANQPPPLNFSDGPPWSEDEDLQSPVVLPKPGPVHRKHKSTAAHMQTHTRGQSKNVFTPTTLQHFPGSRDDKDWEDGSGPMDGVLEPGSSYYTTRAGRRDIADGEPGGELYNHQEEDEYDPDNPHYYHNNPDYIYSDDEAREFDDEDSDYNSRFSKDYQFTIASPAEEMHGKAVALFDFIQENENELPLQEGQVVWVSYRHGMGWLVAEDPKTGESGLVPEEYVRLLRDMQHAPYATQGSEMNPSALMPEAASMDNDVPASPGDRPPVHLSTFSTSSADIRPYPYQLRPEGEHPGTPTANNHKDRIEQIRREQERAVEEEGETPRLRSDAFEPKINGDTVDRPNGDEEFYDAPESQGIDFRENQRKSGIETTKPTTQPTTTSTTTKSK